MVIDNELEVMTRCYDILRALDAPAQQRVIQWLNSKFQANTGSGLFGANDSSIHGSVLQQHESLDTLLGSAKPRKVLERVLVTAAWLQANTGQRTQTANRINKELKVHGKAIVNITQNIKPLVKRGLLEQLSADKKGRTRPVFRVSPEGLRYVNNLLKQPV